MEPLAWVIDKVVQIAPKVLKYWRREPPATSWIPRLNAYLGGAVEIRTLVDVEPTLVTDGRIELTPDVETRARDFRHRLRVNDPVAVLSAEPLWTDKPIVVHMRIGDYASVCALDHDGGRPTLISANALLVCADTKELVLHRRSEQSRDHPHALHTFGGAYMPPGVDGRDFDHDSLIKTARRETAEESGIGIDITKIPAMLVGSEPAIRFMHLALLGMQVSKEALDLACKNDEGAPTRVRCDELFQRLTSDSWVPAGKAQVLAWLALGAPTPSGLMRFAECSGQQLFNRIVPE